MSHATTASTQKMAIHNVRLPPGEMWKASSPVSRADSYCQPQPFDAVSRHIKNAENSTNGRLNTVTFGGKANAWGSSSIWSDSTPNVLTPSVDVRDKFKSRDPAHMSMATPGGDLESEGESKSQLASTMSEDRIDRSHWSTRRMTPSGQPMPAANYFNDNLLQQRNVRNSSNPLVAEGTRPNLQSLGHPPQAVSLSPFGSSAQSCTRVISTQGDSLFRRASEQIPSTTCRRIDRLVDLSSTNVDSVAASWIERPIIPSRDDERRPQFLDQRNSTFPISRDRSLPRVAHANDIPIFTLPDYSRSPHRPSPESSRAPSICSARDGLSGISCADPGDRPGSQYAQIWLGSDSRPSTSYRSSPAAKMLSGNATPSWNGSPGRFNQEEPPRSSDSQESDRADLKRCRPNCHASPQQSIGAVGRLGKLSAEPYMPSHSSPDFRAGQPHTRVGASSPRYRLSNGSRSPVEYRSSSNGSLSFDKRSPTATEQQVYWDPRIPQLTAAHLYNLHANSYNQYAVNALPFSPITPYLGAVQNTAPTPHLRDLPVVDGVQSALMYEFKSSSKAKRYELRDIYGHVAEFSGDQHGSRFIQTKLETANSDEKARVFVEIQPNAMPLMTDVFGNYVIQKFFEHGDQTHKKILANDMCGKVLHLSLQMYGCRVVQKALDHVLVDQQASLIEELKGHVMKCVKDQNGNHVIQKAIQRCSSATVAFIVDEIQGHLQQLSIHTYGCRVIQRCLERRDLPARPMFMAELMQGISTMISDQFGNYVIQHVVEHADPESKQRALAVVAQGLENYSKHKFASNVVEKCIEKCDDNWRRQVVQTLSETAMVQQRMRPESGGIIVSLIKDSYGNYVIQKLLDTLCEDDYFTFLQILRPSMQQAKRTGCGKQVLSIEKKMHRYASSVDDSASIFPTFDRTVVQLPIQLPDFASKINSAPTTPPPLTADTRSLESSCVPSVNGDASEEMAIGRKC